MTSSSNQFSYLGTNYNQKCQSCIVSRGGYGDQNTVSMGFSTRGLAGKADLSYSPVYNPAVEVHCDNKVGIIE